MKRSLSVLLLLTIIAAFTPRALADEGMWTFDNLPREAIKQRYGFDVTDAWVEHVMKSTARFNGIGSGAIVSADGLILTNHHIASDTLAKLSTPDRDYFKTGFHARTRDEEARAPDLEINVLQSIQDVTDRVNSAVEQGMGPAEAKAARSAAIAEIEEESTESTGLRSDVVKLYQGGLFHLHRYKRYTDVRLVFAPEFSVAFFGGDKDNFTYPRYNLDIAFFRVYEDGKPARTEHFFELASEGARENDLVFVAGNPAWTERQFTVAHLEYLRDVEIPYRLEYYRTMVAALLDYASKGDEQRRQIKDSLFGYQNSQKAYTGRYEGLEDNTLLGKRRAAEEALRKKVLADKELRARYADAWAKIALARKRFGSFLVPYRTFWAGDGFNSVLFERAMMLVRLAEESRKPNAQRLKMYTDSYRKSLEHELFSEAPIYKELEKARLAASFDMMERRLGGGHPVVKKVLAGRSPSKRAAELVEGTRLGDVAYRRTLAEGGLEAITRSNDPMIALARIVDPEARALRVRYEDEVAGVETEAYARLAAARFAVEGTKVYPDATFTPRLSFGAVKGYSERGKQIEPFTTFKGMYALAAASDNKEPYVLPERWLDRRERLGMDVPFNFVSTNDIIGGNSGSAVLNRKAEVVGVVFDGNIQSLVGSFIYDETQNRTVSVDIRAILEALEKVYEAEALLEELKR